MKNDKNLYDINGNLLRAAGDTAELSVEEAEKRMKEYQEQLRQLPENEQVKASVLRTYIKNLQSYIFNYYIIHPEEYSARIKTTEQQVKEAMEKLKSEVDNEESDEYVDFEEVKDAED